MTIHYLNLPCFISPLEYTFSNIWVYKKYYALNFVSVNEAESYFHHDGRTKRQVGQNGLRYTMFPFCFLCSCSRLDQEVATLA